MKNRSIAAVLLLPLVTFGIYSIYWFVSTKNEMNKLGAGIPTAWLIIIPFVNIYWMYKYCEGADKVTGGKMSTVLSFILLFILGWIGGAFIQAEFNKLGEAPAIATTAPAAAFEAPIAPEAPVTPTDTTIPPTTPTNPVV